MENPSALADFILDCWDQAVQMRAAGVSMLDVQSGLAATVVEGARVRGLITADEDLPRWMWKHCAACLDSGWEPTVRQVRGEIVEAYRRCTCQASGMTERQDDHAVAAKVASGWKHVGKK